MNIHVDTLEYANDLQKAGIERAHAEAIARLQARTVTDLAEHELVTKENLKSELTQLETRLRAEMGQVEVRLRTEMTQAESRLREEIRSESTAQRRHTDALMIQIRALQFGGAIAAFEIGAMVLMARLIR